MYIYIHTNIELGVTFDWNPTLKTGKPVRSDLVGQYMALKTEQQKRAGVLVEQAPALLSNHLVQIVGPMQLRLHSTSSPYKRVVLARDIAFFTVAFSTTKRGAELTSTLVQRVLRLPNHCGLMFNFQWGKTQRDGADHILTINSIRRKGPVDMPGTRCRAASGSRELRRLGHDER